MFDRDAIVARLTKLQTSLEEMRAYLKIDERQARLDAAEAKQAEPGFWDNPEVARSVIAEGNADLQMRNMMKAMGFNNVTIRFSDNADNTKQTR